MKEFIKLIEDIGFVKSDKSAKLSKSDFFLYSYNNEYQIFFIIQKNSENITETKWSMVRKNKTHYEGNEFFTWGEAGGVNRRSFSFNEIWLLKEHFQAYFRDNKLKKLGI